MKEFWNQRYSDEESVYGKLPNLFFKNFIDSHKAGTLLLPADGEGRNAVYAAQKGWEVDAFDFSEVAREKALQFANEENVSINYSIKDITTFKADKMYDVVGLIYVHLPVQQRKKFHAEIYKSINPGGYLVFEAFTKEQIHNTSGGPKDLSMLYEAPEICNDFPFLHLLNCEEKDVELNEGLYHRGPASLLRLIGQHL